MPPAGISNTSGILPRRIFVVLWVLHKLVLRPYKFWKGYLPYVPPSSTSSDCRENCHWSTALSVLPDARSLSSKDDHFEHLVRYFAISNLPTPPPPRRSVLFFTNSNMVTLRSWWTPLLQEEHAYRSLTDTIQ